MGTLRGCLTGLIPGVADRACNMYRVVDEGDRLLGAATTIDVAQRDLAWLVDEVATQVAATGEGASRMRLQLRVIDPDGQTVALFSGSPAGGFAHSDDLSAPTDVDDL